MADAEYDAGMEDDGYNENGEPQAPMTQRELAEEVKCTALATVQSPRGLRKLLGLTTSGPWTTWTCPRMTLT